MVMQVAPGSLAGEFEFDGRPFPWTLECRSPEATLSQTIDWADQNSEALVAEASAHGAVLFRGFPIRSDLDFDAFVAAFRLPNYPYEQSLSNAVRVVRTPRVFTANEAPAHVTIFLHHEMAQTPRYPSHLFFYCEKAAETGGATPICRSDVLWSRLQQESPEFAAECETKGLRYANVMPPENDPTSGMGRSWQSTLRADTREAAEQRLQEYGYSWEWLDDGCLRAVTPVLPAVRRLPDGRTTFFNQLIAAFQGWKDARNDPSRAITFGDGTRLDREAVDIATRIGEELSFDVPWQAGDVVLIDNAVAMHGRRAFTGTRKVFASLIAANAMG